MIGTGMGTSGGFGYSGIYGQQPWQKEERSQAFSNAYTFALTRGGTRSLSSIGEDDINFALQYASSLIPRGATFVGGSTNAYLGSGFNVPSFVTGGMKPTAQTGKWR